MAPNSVCASASTKVWLVNTSIPMFSYRLRVQTTVTAQQPDAVKAMTVENAVEDKNKALRLRGGCIPCPGEFSIAINCRWTDSSDWTLTYLRWGLLLYHPNPMLLLDQLLGRLSCIWNSLFCSVLWSAWSYCHCVPCTTVSNHMTSWCSPRHLADNCVTILCYTCVGGIIIRHMNCLWNPIPGPGWAIITILNLVFIPLHKTRK